MKNKNAILRYEAIDNCLRTRRGYTISELVDACNENYRAHGMEGLTVRNRQVLYDIEEMPVIYKDLIIQKDKDPKDHRRTLFSYPEGARGINGERLQDQDYGDFNQAIWLLDSLVGLPYVQKAAETLKKKIKPDDGGEAPVFAVDTNKDLLNFDQLGSYFHAIRRKDPIKVTYLAHYEDERVFWFQPYYLKQYNNRWFLFGWNYDFLLKDGTKGRIENLAIDRIRKKEYNRASFSMNHTYRPNDIDFEHYFDDVIGVTHFIGTELEHIVMKIHDKNDWFRLQTKPIHHSQQMNPDDFTMSIDVRPNPELYATLSQFEHLEVVSPAHVRDAYIERIKTILGQYE